MDWGKSNLYWKAITEIEAQELLLQLRVADYPYLKEEDKKKTHRQFHRLAYPNTETTETLTTGQMAERLRAAIHGK